MKKNTTGQYRTLMQQCETEMVSGFSALLGELLANIDSELLDRSEKAHNNEMRNRYQDTLYELLRDREKVEALFCQSLRAGFCNFVSGSVGAGKEETPVTRKKGQLSLLKTDQYEKDLAINQVVHSACNRFISVLFALNRRLAVVNDGNRISETSGDFPAGPRHLCNAFVAATAPIEIDPKIELELIELVDRYVVSQAEPLYNDFNDALHRAGLLPDLLDADHLYEIAASQNATGHALLESEGAQPSQQSDSQCLPSSQAPEASEQPPTQRAEQPPSPISIAAAQTLFAQQSDAVIGEHLYQGINELLARRYRLQIGKAPAAVSSAPGFTAAAGTASPPGLIDLLNALQQAATQSVPQQAHCRAPAEPLVAHVKATFGSEVAKLVYAKKKGGTLTSSAATIDLVGLLFKHILDDAYIPDSVKALLGHLHTPYLKMALLDDQFFVGDQNSARQLLNAVSYAGSRCNADDANDLTIVAKIQEIVHRILNEFDQNTELFTELLDDFSRFIQSLSRRSEAMERRAVQTVQGRQKLQRVRQQVSTELIDRCVADNLPEPIQDLLLNAWANYLVITLLRNGENSDEWRDALTLTDDLVRSVKPKKTHREKVELYDKIPGIMLSVRTKLRFIGLLDGDIRTIQDQITACHKAALLGSEYGARTSAEQEQAASEQTSKKALRSKMPEEWTTKELSEDNELEQQMTPELKSAAARIKKLELGTWFELVDNKSGRMLRGKLAWANQQTFDYMFVNQSGRQIAIISRYDLAKALVRDDARILPIAKTPLITRALESIHRMLQCEKDCAEPAVNKQKAC